MNNKILIPILIVAIVGVGIVVAITLTKEEKVTNTAVTNTAVDPLQTEEAALDSLLNTINTQTSDEAIVPEMDSTLSDLESNSASVSADQALDDTSLTNEEQALTDLESSINASQSDESTVGETSNTLLDTTQ